MSTSLRARAVSGVRWTIINSVGEKALSFGTTMVLARMLDPKHFGVYALAFVAIDTFQILKNLGLDAALIQRNDHIEEAADTVFMVLPLIGLTLFGILYVLSPWLAQLLRNPDVGPPMQILGFVLVLRSIGNVPAALVQKAMRFDIRTIANLTGMAVYMVMAVWLARHGWGVWSLVAAYLTRWLVTIPLQWIMIGWVPRWRFDGRLLKDMLHFSKYVLGTWIVSLFMMNVDKIAMGRWLGEAQLGYYTLCLGLANIMMTQLSVQMYQVAFPAFAQAQHDIELMRRGVVKVVKYLALFALPVGILLALAPADLLRVAYGSRWVGAAPMLQILAIAGVLQTIRSGLEPIQLGSGHSKVVFRLNVLQLVLLTIGAVAMARAHRPLGVAWAVVIAAALPLIVNLQIVLRQVDLHPRELVARLSPIGFSGAAMAGAMLLGYSLRSGLGAWAQVPLLWLAGLVPLTGLAYVVGIFLWDRPMARDLLHMIRHPATA